MLRSGKYTFASKRGIVILSLWIIIGSFDRQLLCQDLSTENWEIGRIFVREEEHGKQIPRDYWPIEISELDRRLEAHRKRRMQRAINPPYLENAVYVAILNRDGLVSEKSRWQFRCAEGQRLLTIQGVSCALTDARFVSENKALPEKGVQLFSSNTRFAEDGSIIIEPTSTNEIRWFGFQAAAVGTGELELLLPPALTARMVIAADASQIISSADVVVEPIESPEEHLPSDWGDPLLPAAIPINRFTSNTESNLGHGKIRWWLAHLSGVSKFSLVSRVNETVDATRILHALSKSFLRYTVDESSISVAASFEPIGSSRQPFQFRLHPSLRLVDASSETRTLNWTTIVASSDSTVIQIATDSTDSPKRVELRAIARLPLHPGHESGTDAQRIPLPGLELLNSFALNGVTAISGSRNYRVTQVDSEVDYTPSEASFSNQFASSPEDVSDSSPILEWQSKWVGNPRTAFIQISPTIDQWDVEGLTFLTFRESAVTAKLNLRFVARYLRGNTLLLPISNCWTVDRAQVVNDEQETFRLKLLDGPDGRQHIEIRWDGSAESVRFQLELLARRPNFDQDKILTIDEARLVSPLHGSFPMVYVAEESDGYQLRYTPQLIQMSISKQELPVWQKNLIGDTDSIVFKDCSNGQHLFQVEKILDRQSQHVQSGVENTSGLSIEQSDFSSGKSWIWSETTVHRWSDTGTAEHEIDLEVQSQSHSTFSVLFPQRWQLQSLEAGERVAEGFSLKPGCLQVPLLQGKRNSLKFRFTSQETPLDWLSRIAIESPHYDIPVLQRNHSLITSPKYRLLSFRSKQMNSSASIAPGNVVVGATFNRWKPSAWFGWLNWDESVSNENFGKTAHHLKTPIDTTAAPQVIYVLDRHALISLTSTAVVIMSVLSWLVLRKSIRVWWLVLCLSMGVNLVIDDRWLMLSNLLLLSLACGVVCRIAERIVTRSHSSTHEVSVPKSAVVVTVLLHSFLCCSSAIAQSTVGGYSAEGNNVSTYGVFIPSDSANQPVGEYAYIPKQLRDILYNDQPGANEQTVGSVLSANYSFRLRYNERERDLVQTCIVELQVLIHQANTEFLIPIKGLGLNWTGTPLLNGQARVWGGRNFSIAKDGAGVSFRSDSVGVMDLKLEFIPAVIEEGERRFRIVVDIPPIPTAKARIVTVGAISNLSVQAKGLVQRTFLGDTIANLGPTDKLIISWSVSQRPSNMAPSEQVSETWLHAQADQILASCQLTIQRVQNLPREMDLIVTDNWRPIGESWKDVELIDVGGNSNSIRNIYRVRRKQLTGDNCTIQLMLIPKQKGELTGLTAPFVIVDRINTKETYLWWSSDLKSGWIPEISESRPVRDNAAGDWGAFALATQRVGYQIFGTGVAIRKQMSPAPNVPISEVNSLYFRRHHTLLTYTANWEPTGNQFPSLLISLPPSLSPPKLEINGVPAKYQLDADHRLMLISMKDNGIGRLGRLRLQLELPVIAGKVRSVPRISVWKTPAKKSVLELFCGSGLEIRHHHADQEIVFEPSERRLPDADSLQELDVKFGQLDLSQLQDHGGSIPIELDVDSVNPTPPSSEVVYLQFDKLVWKATVRATWDDDSKVPRFAYFDLPLTARDGLTAGNIAFKLMPHKDPHRTILCIPVLSEPGSTSRVEFSFPLSGNTGSRTISIPSVRSLESETPMLVALPKVIDEVPVQWQGMEQRLIDPGNLNYSESLWDGYEFYSATKESTIVTWQSPQKEQQVTDVFFTLVDIKSSATSPIAGVVRNWLDTKGQTTQLFSIPDNCAVRGVQCNGQDAQWSVTGSELTILLPATLVPVQLNMIVQWNLENSHSIRIPLPMNQNNQGSIVISLPKNFCWKPVDGWVTKVKKPDEYLTNLWANAIVSASQYLPNIPEPEASDWMAHWNPVTIGIPHNLGITNTRVLENSIAVDLDSDGTIRAEELWKGLDMIVDSSPQETAPSLQPLGGGNQVDLFQLSKFELAIEPVDTAETNQAHVGREGSLSVIALSVLLLLAFGSWLVPERLLRLPMLVGIDWCLLAVLLWLLQPIYWVGALAALAGLWQVVQQLTLRRRRVYRG